jgi:hypothetical protein
MLRTDAMMPLYLMKLPSSEDQSTYDKVRADALVKAHVKYLKKLAEYNSIIKANAKAASPQARVAVPDKPIEPTEANFEFTAFPLMAGVSVGPMNRFAKGDDLSTYLEELTPGDYRIYGPVSVVNNGAAFGTCFCMGSVAFTAKAGEIVDLGVVMSKQFAPAKRPSGDSSAPMLADRFLEPSPSGTTVDPRLTGATIVPAKFRAVGKLPNYFGLTVARMPAIPGVLQYDRDRIVDLSKGD